MLGDAANAASVIDRLARAASLVGPTAFGFGAGVGLVVVGLLLRAGDRIDYATFKLALIVALVLVAVAGTLALVRFWRKATLVARIAEADLAADRADRAAAQDRIAKHAARRDEELL